MFDLGERMGLPVRKLQVDAPPVAVERRSYARNLRVNGSLPGKLVDYERHDVIQAVATDVSRNGVGIMVNRLLQPGQILTMVMAGKNLSLKVIHSYPHLTRSGHFICGLECQDRTENLESIFSASGCLL
jgi:hypothetical protein